MTETGGGEHTWVKASKDGLKGPLGFAGAVLEGMNYGHVSLWTNWQFSSSGGLNQHNFMGGNYDTSSKKFAVGKHMFRYVRPGAIRVAAQVDGREDLYASAWKHKENKTMTLLFLNPGRRDRLEIALPETIVQSGDLRAWQTTRDDTFAPIKLELDGATLSLPIDRESVITVTNET